MLFSASHAPLKAGFFLFTLLRLAQGQSLPPQVTASFPPIASPTGSPVLSVRPTLVPIRVLTVSPAPVVAPTGSPSQAPTSSEPTVGPTVGPSLAPVTDIPTAGPSLAPITATPTTFAPTAGPTTALPTQAPTPGPTSSAPVTFVPTSAPVTFVPTSAPSLVPVTLAPTSAPVEETLSPVVVTSIPTSAPAASSAPTPAVVATSIPTSAPATSSAPTPVVVVTGTPTSAPAASAAPTPVVVVTSTPTSAPATAAPSTSSAAPSTLTPTLLPTDAPVTSGPTIVPTTIPTASPSIAPVTSPPSPVPTRLPTAGPTTSPVSAPTTAPQIPPPVSEQSENFKGIRLTLEGVGELDSSSSELFASVTEVWFEEFYNGLGGRRKLAFGDGIDGVSNMKATVTFRSQDPLPADAAANRDFAVNTIVYDQQITYDATADAPTADELMLIPFEDTFGNAKYAIDLRSSGDPTLASVQSPIESPELSDGDDDDGLSTGVIAGIAVAGAFGLLGAIFLVFRLMGDGDAGGYVDQDARPVAQFNVAASEDVSTMDDPAQKVLGSGDASLAEYGDQSVATVDYDYSKAYGGGGDASVVSSAGGTFGDNTRQSTGIDAAGAAARTALGASFDSESQFQTNVKESVLVINAPPGKLGVVIDTPDDGAPVVHAVKDSSVISDQIRVGDKLVAVDNEDVRSMTAIKVSKLISRKSANPSRKLTVVRTSVVEGP